MKDPRHEVFEAQRQRAVALGNTDDTSAHGELVSMLRSPFPIVRKAAAGALVKMHARHPSLAASARFALMEAIQNESGEQVRQYMLRALAPAAGELNEIDLENLRDIARNPTLKQYVRMEATGVLAAAETAAKAREARMRHWCTRCRRPVTVEESAAGIRAYGKPYCHHCLEERRLEDLNFEADVEKAKRLRTVDAVAVQSMGEKRIGDWLAAHHIAYRYDERIRLAGDLAIRPDFYLPEFDVYVEYWGMNTPEYVGNMRKKQFLYQRDRKKLISLSWREQDHLEELLAEKLARYVNLAHGDASSGGTISQFD